MIAILKRCATSFAISSFCGTVVNLVIEIIGRKITGMTDFTPFTKEYLELFSSQSLAVEVNILLYGLIGATFAAMAFIYEIDRIGFIFQNLIYFILTGVVWVPVVMLVWQLGRYPKALIGTIIGFAITYLIMSIVGYRTTKKEVEAINSFLE